LSPFALDRGWYFRLIRGQTRSWSFPPALLRGGLALAAAGYGAAVRIRNHGYDRGWLKVHQAGIPVVSVGNLTVGGTGKTPMVEWVARWFRSHEVRVAILSRGYGQTGGVNDEGRVLEENLPDVPHLQAADRVHSAALAVSELEAELIVLDDGFQHRRIARDVDLVLLDALEPFGLGRLLPRGLLREPIRSLRRASVVVLSRADLVSPSDRSAIRAEAEDRARYQPLRWVEARHSPVDVVDGEGASSPLEILSGRSVAAFCGIGNPEGFRRTILPLCRELRALRTFPDHHAYTARDVGSLEAWARQLNADLVLTTQKDLVKLRASVLGPIPLRALRIGLEITNGAAIMDDVLARLLPAHGGEGPLEKDFS
jgi:tetraacyldisaccharide 4'-kinase